MQELLHQIDSDYYRFARLLILRADIEQLHSRSAIVDVDIRSKLPPGMSRSPDSSRRQPYLPTDPADIAPR
jgi:hypothetical protein